MTKQGTDRPARQNVALHAITTQAEVFQFRHVEVDEHHVGGLAAVLKSGNPLDPLTLWKDPETGGLVVVDGHHRFAAYQRAGWSKKVPVVVHSCSLEQARLLALRENGKTRLPLSNVERTDAAWALVCLRCPEYSKRVIVKTTGVADGTVAKMRRTLKTLLELDPEAALPDQWWQAMAVLKGREQREYTEDEREAMILAKAEKLDDQIGKALGDMAANQIEAVCLVLEKRLGRQGMKYLVEEYGDWGTNTEDEFPF